jgi:hypothetical protein
VEQEEQQYDKEKNHILGRVTAGGTDSDLQQQALYAYLDLTRAADKSG